MTASASNPLKDQFVRGFNRDRELLSEFTDWEPSPRFEDKNWGEYLMLRKTLDAHDQYAKLLHELELDGHARDVAQQLDKSHKAFQKRLKPDLKEIARRLKTKRMATKKARRRLEDSAARAGPEATAKVAAERPYLDTVDEALRGARKLLVRHFNAIVRRAKLERVGLEALQAFIFLVVFEIGAERMADLASGWARHFNFVQELPHKRLIGLGVWLIVVAFLFAAVRWWLGPCIERWFEARRSRSVEKELELYWRERTHVEYGVATLKHANETSSIKP